jgi:hypothetical protein
VSGLTSWEKIDWWANGAADAKARRPARRGGFPRTDAGLETRLVYSRGYNAVLRNTPKLGGK